MTAVPFNDLRLHVESIREEVMDRVQDVFRTTSFILREHVERFEAEFAEFLGVRHVIGVGNGTDALVVALKALDLPAGAEVVTAANSFVATGEAIVLAGATPVFVDIDEATFNLDPRQLEAAITERTAAIVPVHLYGRPADLDAVLDIARRHGLRVVEDAAQAHGARHRGRRVGSFGDLACFSFYPTKNLGAFGDAGAVATDDDELALRVRLLHDHGGVERDQHDLVGQNSRLDGLQAAVLSVGLRRLDEWNGLRRRHAEQYTESLGDLEALHLPAPHEGHIHHIYVVRVKDDRDALLGALQDSGIGAGVHYPRPIPLTRAFAYLGVGPQQVPVAARVAGQMLSLPMYPELTAGQVDHVCQRVRSCLRR